jgi:hypothetical protein
MKQPSMQFLKTSCAAFIGPILLALSALVAATPQPVQGQVASANPPKLMTYQGYLVDANGAPLATNAPQNYDVIFRIYTAAQGGDDLWAEQQTVTVDKGYFSVLLGEGSQYNTEPHPNLAGLFDASDASDRYVEITVKGIGSGGGDITILPRLRLLTSLYSFLAQNAITASNIDGAAVTSGIVPDARLSGNVARLDASQTFTGANSFSSSDFLPISVISGNTAGTGLALGNSSGGGRFWQFISSGSASSQGAGKLLIGSGSATDSTGVHITLQDDGKVGIGTTTPQAGLEVETASAVANGKWGYLNLAGYQNNSSYGYVGSPNLDIYTAGGIGASTYYTFSDQRIKNIIDVSSGDKDLKTLMGIRITDYTYKDTIKYGKRQFKKVIAQQVESVYPQAVTKTTGVIPDIYRQADLKEGWIQLATDLKKGDQVKLIGEQSQGIYEVLAVKPGAFRTGFQSAGPKVFVYGREVKDFCNVDYQAIAMLNVSATQELARRLEAQSAEIATLKQKITALTSLSQAVDALKSQLASQQHDEAKRLAQARQMDERLATLEKLVHVQTARAGGNPGNYAQNGN